MSHDNLPQSTCLMYRVVWCSQNMSTYKELCSIANDLNQPDLIYKFLHLANHQATWNTKKVVCLNSYVSCSALCSYSRQLVFLSLYVAMHTFCDKKLSCHCAVCITLRHLEMFDSYFCLTVDNVWWSSVVNKVGCSLSSAAITSSWSYHA